MTLCVYALTGSAARIAGSGASGERLRLVREGTIAAVVGELRRRPRPSPDNLRRYDQTMRSLAAGVPALLPARFGSCFDDRDELRFVLRSRRTSIGAALRHVRRRVQMTVRVIERPVRAAAQPVRVDSAGRRSDARSRQSGAAYLRARAESAARDRNIPGFETVRDAVARWVRDERVERRAGVTTVYHLVPRQSAELYRNAIDRVSGNTNLPFIVSGPWPAYAFADTW